jgi:Mn2+/Fe2+ NRAMP family transporter
MRVDIWSGMFFSNLVMFFIIAICAATLFQNGITSIGTAAEAALALQPLAGNFAFWLFAFGLIGVGLLAIPVLAGSASYALAEALNWKAGLHRKLKQASSFYGVIIVSMLLGIGINFIGLHPIRALIYAAVLNGLISPIILFLIVKISSQEEIMGHYKNGNLSKWIGWFSVGLLTVVSFLAIIFLFV